MQKLLVWSFLALMATSAASLAAVTVVECVDGEGNSSFRDKCPPGMTKTADKILLGVAGPKEDSVTAVAEANPITLYTVPDCDACDLVRNVLTQRNLPYTEKDVQDDATSQDEMKAATGGLTVPALTIGSSVLTGYSRAAIDGALQQAGYPATGEPVQE